MLLALSRGAGMAGLSGMPAHWQRGGLHFHRPLLQVAGKTLREWLAQQGESFVDDPTNADVRYTRNHIRAQVMPALEAVFPQFRDTFTRSARHAAQANTLLEELASEDWSHDCARRDAIAADPAFASDLCCAPSQCHSPLA